MSTRWSATSPVPLEDIAPGAVGRAELRGTVWSARNGAARALVARRALPRRDGRAADDHDRARRSPLMDGVGLLIVAVILALLALVVIAKTAIVVPQQSAYVVERLGPLQRDAQRRLPHPDAVRGHDPLPPLAEGDRRRHPGAGLHHPRQRAGRRRRRALSQGAQSRARVVRHHRLHVRHQPARPDDAAQRGRQDRSGQDVRGADQHQHAGRHRARQGDRSRGA